MTARERFLDQNSTFADEKQNYTPQLIKKKLVDVFNIEACDNKSSHYRSNQRASEGNLLKNMRDKNRSSKVFGFRAIRPTESKNKYDGSINTRFSNSKFGALLRKHIN